MPTSVSELETHKVIGYAHNQPSNILVTQGEDGTPHYVTGQCQVKTVAGLIELAQTGLGIINAPSDSVTICSLVKENLLKPILEEYCYKLPLINKYEVKFIYKSL